MIAKEKMFLVASNVDDSIKSATPVYDITIFSDWLKFEQYINVTPIVLGSIIVSSRDLQFTSTNMQKLLDCLRAPFLKLTGPCIYLIDNDTPMSTVKKFLDDAEISNVVIYQGDLSANYISSIVSGAGREADESETEVVTYRMRASEYTMAQNIKKYESDMDDYETDEDLLSEVPDLPEPMMGTPTIDVLTNIYYVVGKCSIERSLFAYIEAQYLSLTGKTVIMESDVNYHTLTDMALKSQVTYDYIAVEDFVNNPSDVITRIKGSLSKLIVLGCTKRIIYDYDFIMGILMSTLNGFVDFFVKECNFDQTPYSCNYNIVCGDTVPDVLECVDSLKYDVDENKVIFVGVRTRELGEINISSTEMTDLVRVLLEKEKLQAQVVYAGGVNLKGEEVAYDVFGIIGRGNERQGRGL